MRAVHAFVYGILREPVPSSEAWMPFVVGWTSVGLGCLFFALHEGCSCFYIWAIGWSSVGPSCLRAGFLRSSC
jgi:hypothetical protein